jgi:MATE family multidrug resistance protein
VDELRALARLAWPAVVGQLGIMAMGVVDLWAVGTLGKEATAAVGIGNTLSWGTLIVAFGAVHGADGVVAQAFGAGRPRAAGTHAARIGVVAAVLGVVVTALHLLAEPILAALDQPADVVPLAGTYVRGLAWSVPAVIAFQVIRQLLQGQGLVRPAMVAVLLGNVANLVLVTLLVRWLGWGLAGAALATSVVRCVMLLGIVVSARDALREAWPDGRVFEAAALRGMAWLAAPVAFQMMLEVWAFNVGVFLAGTLGAAEAAAHTVALNLASLSFMVPLGISSAASTRVGNAIGAGEPWARRAWTAVGAGASVMSLSALAFLLFPRPLGAFYNDDPVVVALVASVLPIAGLFQLFDGTQVVAFGVLRGRNDLRAPALFNVVGYWLVGLPLAVWLVTVRGVGLAGVWIGYSVGLGIVATLLVARLAVHTMQTPARAATESA